MLQRIQTIYLSIFVALSAVLLSGISILDFQATGEFVQEPITLTISALNIEGTGKLNLPDGSASQFAQEMKNLPFTFSTENQTFAYNNSSPLLIVQILLTLFAVMTIVGYKNLKRQLRLARATFFLTLLYVVGVMAMVYFALDYVNPYLDEIPLEELKVTRNTHVGFYIICAMLPFAYLAQMGIKRDLNLIKSLDRLR